MFKNIYSDRLELVIVSDRHPNIGKAIWHVYPDVFHGICMQHHLHNIKTKFIGIFIDNLYYLCAKAYHVSDFDQLMHELGMVEPRLRPYLQEVGVHRWFRAHIEGRRYNIMTTYISQCLNAMFVKERELPVTTLVDEMRSIVQCWHYECRSLTEKFKTKPTPVFVKFVNCIHTF